MIPNMAHYDIYRSHFSEIKIVGCVYISKIVLSVSIRKRYSRLVYMESEVYLNIECFSKSIQN